MTSSCCSFQSTRPLRGATVVDHVHHKRQLISIHAPLAGRDEVLEELRPTFGISIHAPLAGRDEDWITLEGSDVISIHAPLAGRDLGTVPGPGATVISIHAPLAGRDLVYAGDQWFTLYFNPRAPCGARPQRSAKDAPRAGFQSTRPLRGATVSPINMC